ncbi:hypothetical protein CDAR_255231 [Caerostris darwini]|uniref:Uncharacterized protein n=1 Tax=Caerostris darwini TaxID=1538125 RepID=A0AAV4V133_9ARAC|nr:hypothetical protein CDAR_255231 [Caerostris darwini]
MPLSSPQGVPLRCCAIQTGAYRLVGRNRNLLAGGVGASPPDLMPSNLLGRYARHLPINKSGNPSLPKIWV